MPRTAKPLTATTINNAIRKCQGKTSGTAVRGFPLWDGRGLHLIDRAGRYHWRLKYYRPNGRENRLALGGYPAVSLKEARQRADDARRELRQGIDPGAARKATKAEEKRKSTATFQHFGEAWLKVKSPGWADSTRRKQELVVHSYLIPTLGKRDIRDLASADVLRVLRKIDARAPALTRKAAGAAQGIVRLAIAEGARDDGRLLDLDLRANLPKQHKGHFAAATTPRDVETVMRTLREMPSPVIRAALLVTAYTAQRPGNVVTMRWQDVDMDHAEWTIPAEAMKMRRPHVVPLSPQVMSLLANMRRFSAEDQYIFPPLAKQKTPHLHRDSLSKALRQVGLRGKQTPHGLRAAFRTVARERLGISADVLEAQLAHAKQGEVQSAYDRTGFLEERRHLMQRWADYLDATIDTNVTPLHRKAG